LVLSDCSIALGHVITNGNTECCEQNCVKIEQARIFFSFAKWRMCALAAWRKKYSPKSKNMRLLSWGVHTRRFPDDHEFRLSGFAGGPIWIECR
jgi:hypothetical protein